VDGVPLSKHLRRPEAIWADVIERLPELANVNREVARQVLHDLKYAGYVARQHVEVDRQARLAQKRIPDGFRYESIEQLRAEAREKFMRIRPRDLSQASRISGITPADLALLMVHLEGKRRPAKAR
jgi:tRNA uridine 5-carboxymethylaminomethyl modification enzyme